MPVEVLQSAAASESALHYEGFAMTSPTSASSATREKSMRRPSVKLVGPPLPLGAERPCDLAVPCPAPGRKVAVIVTHGMGSQVPFETLQLIARCLKNQKNHAGKNPNGPPTVRLAELNGTQLPRVEMEILDEEGQSVTVHLYEAYWAPLTEGKVTARDSLWFLFMAGLRGIRSSLVAGKFDRWMFNDWQEFKVSHFRLLATFLLILLTLGSLLLMNAATVLAAAAFYSGAFKASASAALASVFTQDICGFELRLGFYLIPWLVLPMAAVWFARRWSGWGWLRLLLRWPARISWVLALLMTIWTGIMVAYQWLASLPQVHACAIAHAHWVEEGLRSIVVGTRAAHLSGLCSFLFGSVARSSSASPSYLLAPKLIWVLVVALVLAYAVRWFLREFVGDVAAYVSSYSVSKFDELRNDIQKACLDVMRPVYEQRSSAGFEYEHIVVVGHSLGSVISYDTLNALINLPAAPTGSLDVPKRTKCLITFGCPLDKTAFIFRTQRPHRNEVREALAAAKQPLIQDYGFRPFKWVNLYSPDDWISGELNFYDRHPAPASHPPAVDNQVDPEAWIPGAAHTSYWANEALKRVLHAAVMKPGS